MNTTQCPECLSTNVSQPCPQDDVDCLDCGIWFDPADPRNQPDAPQFGRPALDGPPALLYCAICDRDLRDGTPGTPPVVIARWHDTWICTDCLAQHAAMEQAEAEAPDARQPMAQAAYRASGGSVCPQCQSVDLQPSSVSIVESGIATQHVQCLDCDGRWVDHYRLAGYIREDDGDGAADDWDAFLNTAIVEEPHD